MFYIGCHLSTTGGFMGMGKTALELKATTFQFFTRNPRGGAAKEYDSADTEAYRKLAAENNFGPLVAHAPYTLNACGAEQRVRDFAKMAFEDDLRRLEMVPGTLYNFHPGSHVGQGIDTGIAQIAEILNDVMAPNQSTIVLLETMSGKGSEVGSRFEELRRIIDAAKYPEHLGVCLDTCHVYDAGYDVVNHLDDVLAEFDKVIGIDRLKALHINDSKNPFASHKDRHELIGEGSLGLDALRAVVHHPALQGRPFVLETPNDLPGYAKEIALLK